MAQVPRGSRLALLACLSAVSLAAAAVPAAAQSSPQRTALSSFSVSPTTVTAGQSVRATIRVRNLHPTSRLSRRLLVRIGGGEVLAVGRIPQIDPEDSARIRLNVTIPPSTKTGEHTLLACRALARERSRCGGARRETKIDVIGRTRISSPVSPPTEVLAPAHLQITAGHNFGTHATGTVTGPHTFTVTNHGGVTSGPIATSVTGADAGQFTTAADNCLGTALAPGASCTVGARFAPSSTGAKSASIHASGTPGGTAAAALSGTGVNPAALTITPSPHGFGTHATGTTTAQTFTVTNTGAVPSGTIATSVAGTDPGQFTKSADNCHGQTLAAGASCTVSGAFAPTTLGGKSASLSATAAPGGTATTSLTGTGITPANLTISPAPHAYGTRLSGSTTVQIFSVTNTGQQTSGNISLALSGGDTDQFEVSGVGNNCQGVSLADGSSCTFRANFKPTSAGSKTTSLQATASPGGTASSTLTGTGQIPATLTISPESKNFGHVLNGTTSPVQTFTVTNTGGQTSSTITTSVGTFVPAEFPKSSDNCNGQTLAGGASCTLDVAFAPASTGDKNGTVDAIAATGGSASAQLDGTGVATAADLRIAQIGGFNNVPADGAYGPSFNRDLGTFTAGAGGGSTVYIWLKNFGEADARISNSPVPLTNGANSIPRVFANAGGNWCDVQEAIPASSITFNDIVITAGSSCRIALQGRTTAPGPFQTDFTITASPGGSVSGTFTGTGA